MKIDAKGTKCSSCDNKIRWWQGWVLTHDKRSLHTDCYRDEFMAEHSARLISRLDTNDPSH